MQNSLLPIVVLNRAHREPIVTHLLSLLPEARRLRFGVALKDQGVAHYVETIDFDSDGLYGIFNDELTLIAFAHAARAEKMVEFGVSVDLQYRGRGYGAKLFEKSELFARNHYLPKIHIHCLLENGPMMHIVRKAGMKIVMDTGEVDSYLELPPADFGSVTEDVAQDRYANFDLALKRSVHDFEKNSQSIASIYSGYLQRGFKKPKENEDPSKLDKGEAA